MRVYFFPFASFLHILRRQSRTFHFKLNKTTKANSSAIIGKNKGEIQITKFQKQEECLRPENSRELGLQLDRCRDGSLHCVSDSADVIVGLRAKSSRPFSSFVLSRQVLCPSAKGIVVGPTLLMTITKS